MVVFEFSDITGLGAIFRGVRAMRLILEGKSQNKVTALPDTLRRERVRAIGGGSIGDDGIVLVDDKDVDDALQVLRRSGIDARVG